MSGLLCFLDTHGAALTAIATALLFFVTGGLVWVAYFQFRTTRNQLRAYVFPISAALVNLKVGTAPEFQIRIKNSGQTPAYKLMHAAQVVFTPFPRTESLSRDFFPTESTAAVPNSYLGPGGELLKYVDGDRVTGEDFESLRTGKAAIYALGEYRFRDAFGNLRWVQYRFMTAGNVGMRPDGFMVTCEEGNETSED